MYIIRIFGKFKKKIPTGKYEKKTHRDQTNVSWLRIGGTNFGGGEFYEFLENSKKHQWGKAKIRRKASFIVTKRM